MKTKLITSIIMILFASISFAQETTQDSTKVITKLDGTEYIGKILSDDGREVLIETDALGKIYIPKSDIKSIQNIERKNDVVFGEFRSQGPFTTRYAFTNNAHPITKGENYAIINLYGPEVHFAVTDHLSIGAMATWIACPMVLALKYSFQTKNPNLNFSVGTLLGTSAYINSFGGYGGLHWANMTIGNRMNNITLSAGYGYLESGIGMTMPVAGIYYNEYPDQFDKSPLLQGPLFSIAGIAKVGAKASFVFDSMCFIFNLESSDTERTEGNIITPGYYDDVNDVWVDDVWEDDISFTTTVTRSNALSTALLLMPGFRFQKDENHAFQVSLTGISLFTENNDLSFPFPMCSWFYKF